MTLTMAPKVRILREESSIQISACTVQCTVRKSINYYSKTCVLRPPYGTTKWFNMTGGLLLE